MPLHNSRDTFLYILESLSELVAASNAMAFMVERSPHTMQWAMTRVVPINYSDTTHIQHTDLLEQASMAGDEKSNMAHASLIGTHRTYLCTHFGAPPATPPLDDAYFHLVHVIHVHDALEIYICLGRVDPPSFSTEDLDRLAPLTDVLLPAFTRYCLSLGLMPDQQPTTPREQETLNYLLRGLSEKDIAQEMGLTYRSVHQYVTTIYRKLGVRSRPQLMALWLDPPCCQLE